MPSNVLKCQWRFLENIQKGKYTTMGVSKLREVKGWVEVELWRRLLRERGGFWGGRGGGSFRGGRGEETAGGREEKRWRNARGSFVSTSVLWAGGCLASCPSWTCLVFRDLWAGWQGGGHHLLKLLHSTHNLEMVANVIVIMDVKAGRYLALLSPSYSLHCLEKGGQRIGWVGGGGEGGVGGLGHGGAGGARRGGGGGRGVPGCP